MCEYATEISGNALASWTKSFLRFGNNSFDAIEPHLQAFAAKPNIIFILTDDQDLVLDSEKATPSINKLIRDAGASVETGIVS